MHNIEEYIKQPKDVRQSHLDLQQACVERGGFSTYYKGLLAHVLNTTIPSGRAAQVCHACHNAKCSNPNHLYWGTPSENRRDYIDNGGYASPYEATVAKYGLEAANLRQRRDSKLASKAGKGNIGTTKTEEHKRKIAEAIKRKHIS